MMLARILGGPRSRIARMAKVVILLYARVALRRVRSKHLSAGQPCRDGPRAGETVPKDALKPGDLGTILRGSLGALSPALGLTL